MNARPRPLDIIGYRKDGRPIRLIAGGDGTGDPAGTDPGAGGAPATPPAPAPTPAPADPAPFDPKTLSPEAQAYLRQQAADSDAKARTAAKAAAAKEAEDALLAKLGLTRETKPEDLNAAATERDAARAELARERVQYGVERAARAVGLDDGLTAAYLAQGGKLAGLDPSAADFGDKVAALVKQAGTDKPMLKLAPATPAPTPPGGRGAGTNGTAAGSGEGAKPRNVDPFSAIAAHYAPRTQ